MSGPSRPAVAYSFVGATMMSGAVAIASIASTAHTGTGGSVPIRRASGTAQPRDETACSLNVQASQSERSLIAHDYNTALGSDDVWAHRLKHPETHAPANRALSELQKLFGKDSVSEEVVRDPESGIPQLLILVATEMETDHAAEILDIFYRGWWADDPQQQAGCLAVSLIYV